jgi:molecular chaperone GrpE (heat shock protein)
MSEGKTPQLSRLPFWFADATLLLTAGFLVMSAGRALGLWEMLAIVGCVALGAWLAVLPVLKEYDVAVRLAETDHLASTMAKLKDLDALADRIATATGQWQAVQDRATQTAELSRGMVDRLTREAESLASVVSRTSDGEKQTMKLEVDKLRRSEGDWLQSVGRVMDHVFALHVAALKSGQPAVIEQIERFHAACREALRRVGFVPIVASPDETFDPRKHQVAEGPRPPEGTKIDETVAAGYLFQGQLLRPIIVKVMASSAGAEPKALEPGIDSGRVEGASGTAGEPAEPGANAS